MVNPLSFEDLHEVTKNKRVRSLTDPAVKLPRSLLELRLKCDTHMKDEGKWRLPTRNPRPLTEQMNEYWSAGLMSDPLWDVRRYRTFNVVNDFNREALTIEIDFNLAEPRVVRELISVALADWAKQHGVTIEFIKLGRPQHGNG